MARERGRERGEGEGGGGTEGEGERKEKGEGGHDDQKRLVHYQKCSDASSEGFQSTITASYLQYGEVTVGKSTQEIYTP